MYYKIVIAYYTGDSSARLFACMYKMLEPCPRYTCAMNFIFEARKKKSLGPLVLT